MKPSIANIVRGSTNRIIEILFKFLVRESTSIETQTSHSLLNTATQTDSDAFFLPRTVSENSTSGRTHPSTFIKIFNKDASTSTWFQMVELAKPIPVETEKEEIEVQDATTQTEIMEENSKKSFFGLF